MSSIRIWVFSLLAVVILGVVCSILFDAGKFAKTMKYVFSALTLLVLITPLPNILKGNMDFEIGSILGNYVDIDQAYLNHISKMKVMSLEKGVNMMLDEKGYSDVSIDIDGYFDDTIEIYGVKINFQNFVISGGSMNIDTVEDVTSLVAEALGIDKSLISIYE